MRVFLFISPNGDSVSIASRVKDEGHRSLLYINNEKKRRIGNGLVEKHPEQGNLITKDGEIDEEVYKKILYPKPDCIVFDMTTKGFGKLADRFRKEGYPVMGTSVWSETIELDRPYGNKIMKTCGIGTPKTYSFTDYPTAIKFVKDKGIRFVYKPSGNQNCNTTYVARGVEDMIGMLQYYSSAINEEFELQEVVEEGIEVSSELWFNGTDVVNVNHTMEEKALCEGDHGPKTGCMGSVVWIGDVNTKLYKEGVGRLEPALRKLGYRGPIDVNAIVTKDKIFALEFSPRFGYDAIFILLEMLGTPINDLLYGIASGVQKEIKFKATWGMGLDLGVAPFPFTDIEPEMHKGVLIQGLNPSNLKHLWLSDVMKKEGNYVCAGCGGEVGVITSKGETIGSYSPIRDAKRRVMRTLENIVIPDVIYRGDIGDRVSKEYAVLKQQGWL